LDIKCDLESAYIKQAAGSKARTCYEVFRKAAVALRVQLNPKGALSLIKFFE
jgi:hypothetical protein